MAAADRHPLTPAGADEVIDETGGWAVGVRLRLDAADGATADPHASAAEYLLAEVLERQRPAMRELLLRTSVPTALCADLADDLVVGGVNGADFARLTSNAFVSATGEHGWFRYHPLLREMLRAQLRFEDRAAYDETHRRAARWMVHHGEPRQALEHAFAAGDWDLFGEVFVDAAAGELVTAERDGVLGVLRQVPYQDLAPSAGLALCAAAEALTSGRFEAARAHVREAGLLLDDAPPSAATTLLSVLEAASAWGVGDVQTLVTAGRHALDAAEAAPWPYPALESYVLLAGVNHGVGRLLRDGAEAGRDQLAEIVRAHAADGPSIASVHARSYLAWALASSSDLDDATDVAGSALDDATRWGWASYVNARMAFAAAGLVHVLRGDDLEADRLLAQGLAADVAGSDPASTLALRLSQVLVAVSRGRRHAAVAALEAAHEIAHRTAVPPALRDLALRAVTEVEILTRHAYPWLDGRPQAGDLAVAQVARARLMVASGRAAAALPIIRDVLGHASDDVDALTRTEALVTHASVLAHLSRTGVDDALSEALAVAAPSRLLRPFLAVRDTMLDDRLARLVALRTGMLAAAVRDHLGPAPSGPEPEPLVEPLTERELAMLAALPTMESNTEIAADFYVSVNTVKAHLKALYRKLGVGTRREAVRRGRELGLLD